MVLRMELLEVLARDQGVDLGGRQRAVPQQHLQRAQVGAVVEQVGGEAVPQAVRADLGRVDGGGGGVALDQGPELLPARRGPAGGPEQRRQAARAGQRSEEHTSELQSLMRNSYA